VTDELDAILAMSMLAFEALAHVQIDGRPQAIEIAGKLVFTMTERLAKLQGVLLAGRNE